MNALKKMSRSLAKIAFPNILRIYLLKYSGAHIGEDVYIANGLSLACNIGDENNLRIHDRVSIGPNVILILASHPNMSNLRNIKNKYPFIEVNGTITISQDAWIGAGAIVLPNIRIGECSIVGAGSIVTKDVPPFTVVAGNPAKEVKTIQM